MAKGILTWARVREIPGFVGYVYFDSAAGASVKGGVLRDGATADDVAELAERPGQTVRVSTGFTVEPLEDEEIARLGLPAEPGWLSFYRPKRAEAPWRTDAALASARHAQMLDDVQALFFFVAEKRVEQMWVRLTGVDADGGYTGSLLNTPHTTSAGLAAGSNVTVRVVRGAEQPIWVSPAMRDNARAWTAACSACGCDALVEPAAALVARQFPNAPAGATMQQFTTRCPLCQGTMQVAAR